MARAKGGNHTKALTIDLTAILFDILSEYGADITRDAYAVMKDDAPKVVDRLRDTSPKRYGEYAGGWTAETVENMKGESRLTIYNKSKPTLTFLLEKGHRGFVKKDGTRTRDVKGKKHIAPAQQYAEEIIMTDLEKRLKK